MINKVTLIGNVGKDPEVRATGSNKKVAKFSLATSEKRKGAETVTSWHSIVVWENLAEIVEKYVKKGMMLYVDGRINYGKYDDKDGNTHYYTEIIANNIQMLSKKDQAADEGPTNQQKADGNYIPDQQSEPVNEDDLPF